MSGHLVHGDHAFHDDNKLVSDLASLNERLGRYMLRYLAADALQADPVSIPEERALAETMMILAGSVLERANRRSMFGKPAEFEGDATLRRLTNSRPSER
jgi:hypothetical protein